MMLFSRWSICKNQQIITARTQFSPFPSKTNNDVSEKLWSLAYIYIYIYLFVYSFALYMYFAYIFFWGMLHQAEFMAGPRLPGAQFFDLDGVATPHSTPASVCWWNNRGRIYVCKNMYMWLYVYNIYIYYLYGIYIYIICVYILVWL